MRGSHVVFVVSLILLISPTLVSAQDTYGFSWGVSIGDRINYTVDVTSSGYYSYPLSLNEEVILTIEDLPDLTEYTYYQSFPSPAHTNLTYVNGTEIGMDNPLYSYSYSIIVFPIGNWTHYRYLIESMGEIQPGYGVYRFYEDFSSWSLDFDMNMGSTTQNITYQFSKEDGALIQLSSYNYYEYMLPNGTLLTDTLTTEISRISPIVLGPVATLSVVAVIVEVIIVLELVRRYRGRNVVPS